MQLAATRTDTIFKHDYVVAEIAHRARGAFDATLGGDAADKY